MRTPPSFSEFYNYELIIEDVRGGSIVNGAKKEVKVDQSEKLGAAKEVKVDECEKLCTGLNTEALSHATSQLCDLRCQQHSGKYSGQCASTQQCYDASTVHKGRKTSTPHALSFVKMFSVASDGLVQRTSQLQLLDTSNDVAFGMFHCLLTPSNVF